MVPLGVTGHVTHFLRCDGSERDGNGGWGVEVSHGGMPRRAALAASKHLFTHSLSLLRTRARTHAHTQHTDPWPGPNT